MIFPPKIVDLNTSEWDKEHSDPKTGQYKFKVKRYIDYHGAKTVRPKWRFAWCYKSDYSIEDWRLKWEGTDFVTVNDPYWPEGIKPDAEGHYSYRDVVLMKIPLHAYLEQRKKEILKSERATEAIMKQLRDEYGQMGFDLSDEEARQILGH